MPSAAAQAVLSALLEVGPPADGAWVGVTGIREHSAGSTRTGTDIAPSRNAAASTDHAVVPKHWSSVCRPLTQADGIPAARWCGEGNWG